MLIVKQEVEMQDYYYISMLCVILYYLGDYLKNKELFTDLKVLVLAILNLAFLLVFLDILLLNSQSIYERWWLLLLGAIPGVYYQILRFKKSKLPFFQKAIKIGGMYLIIIFTLIKVL